MRYLRLIPVLFLALFSGVAARAASATADATHVHAQLVIPQRTFTQGSVADAGIYLKLDQGWHVYWKNAGDAGEPFKVRWALPEGVTAGETQFLAPKRLPNGPLMDFGYEDEVLFPVSIQVGQSAKAGPSVLTAKASWIVCRESCIPGKAELELPVTIAAAGAKPSVNDADAAVYKRFLKLLPEPLPDSDKAVFQTTANGFRLAVTTGKQETEAQFFPAEQNILDNPAPQTVSPTATGLVLELKKDPNMAAAPAQLAGVLELSGGRNYDIAAAPGVVAAAKPPATLADIVKATALAFLGGIILNLMPCVFPVLFIKGLSLVNSSGQELKKLRGHGEVYTTGILVTFWALVGVLLALKAAGSKLGWGFQFQSPVFLALMAGLLFFLGLSLAGQFEIGLTLTSAGGELAQKHGYAGSFFTGVLAVIVATPCTAPFMGAAIGFALAQSALVTFAIFTALALGLAAPYLLLTFQPAWTRLLPRPGAWMEVLKQATAVPIFGTVIWLVWVLVATRGATAAAAVLAAFLLLAIAGWILGRWPAKRIPSFAAALVVVAAVVVSVYGVATLSVAVVASSDGGNPGAGVGSSHWEPWTQAKVDQYRAEGRPVFVDFTASWCLSCQVNERVVLRTDAVNAAFKNANVALLKADWTERDDNIAQVLASMGRSGVPAYALYPAGSGEATLLPEALTTGIVTDAVNRLPAAAAAAAASAAKAAEAAVKAAGDASKR
jgi:thiol:disulfide interchange protein DsbD